MPFDGVMQLIKNCMSHESTDIPLPTYCGAIHLIFGFELKIDTSVTSALTNIHTSCFFLSFYVQQQLLLSHILAIAILSIHHTGGSVKNDVS